MRVLFTTEPTMGHWHPLVPLARALQQAGHDVAFATKPAACALISKEGFRAFPAGVDESAEERRQRMARLAKIPGAERTVIMWTDYFAGRWAEQSLPDMLAIAHEWRPDLLIRETAEFAGRVVAEHLNIPHATLQVSAYRPNLQDLIAPNLDRLRISIGLPPALPQETLHRYLLISPVPPSLQDPANPLPPTAHSVRHTAFDASTADSLPAWVEQLPDLPTVYATLGTVVNHHTDILQAMLDALRDEPVNVIMTTGHNVDPALFGPQPSHIHIERYIPQSLLFAHSDLIINHGGSGTVREALKHGLPMVVIPVEADQFVNAKRCADLGLASVIAPDRRTPEAIRAAAKEVLAGPSYRQQAQKVREEMQALPGLDYVVGLLERLVRERSPLINPA